MAPSCPRSAARLKITVVGLGYVGTVAAAGLAGAGHDVLGVDIDRRRIDPLYPCGQAVFITREEAFHGIRVPGVKGGEIMYHLGGRALRCGV